MSVTSGGTKSFLVYRKLNGQPIRVTLGRFPDMKIEQARRLAQKRIAEIAEGRNPIKEKKAARQKGITLREVFNDYMKSRERALSSNTKSNYKTIIDSHLSRWIDRPLGEITRDKVEKHHRLLSEVSNSSANKSMRLLRALFNYAHGKYEDAQGNGLYPDNPVNRLSHIRAWNVETRRNSRVKDHELKAWFDAVTGIRQDDDLATQTVADYLIFTLLNGLRRQEAGQLLFSDIDFEDRTFTVKNTKNRKELLLPLSDYAHQLLILRRAQTNSDFVFPGAKEMGPLNDPRRVIARVRTMSGVQFTMHDLRRTFITVAESLDISAYAVKRLVNHSVGNDVTAGYVIWNVDRLRKPMQQIADRVLELGEVNHVPDHVN